MAQIAKESRGIVVLVVLSRSQCLCLFFLFLFLLFEWNGKLLSQIRRRRRRIDATLTLCNFFSYCNWNLEKLQLSNSGMADKFRAKWSCYCS